MKYSTSDYEQATIDLDGERIVLKRISSVHEGKDITSITYFGCRASKDNKKKVFYTAKSLINPKNTKEKAWFIKEEKYLHAEHSKYGFAYRTLIDAYLGIHIKDF